MLAKAPATGAAVLEEGAINAGDYLPHDSSHFHYVGSRTTPPCDEGVLWYVMDEPRTISAGQVYRFMGLAGRPK